MGLLEEGREAEDVVGMLMREEPVGEVLCGHGGRWVCWSLSG